MSQKWQPRFANDEERQAYEAESSRAQMLARAVTDEIDARLAGWVVKVWTVQVGIAAALGAVYLLLLFVQNKI